MIRGLQGTYKTSSAPGEQVRSFIPAPLPPEPSIEWTPELQQKFDTAYQALGHLDAAAELLPDVSLFLYTYIRKEAVLSSMIEGTQSSLSDLLIYEADDQPGVPIEDVEEVSCYTAALQHGLRRLEEGFPLSNRLLKEMHAVLLGKGRGSQKNPGEFRKSQNWIGGTRPGNALFVPPPPDVVPEAMGKLELFIHDRPVTTPVLVKAALSHFQFGTIHPFLDGNGRLGRLLITLLLCEQKVLKEPLLYLSLYFKTHRHQYYDLLTRVRMNGEWEAWLEFFAEAVLHVSQQAAATARRLHRLADENRAKIAGLGRAAASADRVHKAMLERPITNARWLSSKVGLTPATVYRSLEHLSRLGIVTELTEKQRDRLFSYPAYIDIMNEGTELP